MAIQLVAIGLRRRPAVLLAGSLAVLAAMTVSPYRPIAEIVSVIIRFCPFFAFGYWLANRKAPLIHPKLASPLVLAAIAASFVLGCWLALRWGIEAPVGLYTLPLSALGVAFLMGLARAITVVGPLSRHLAWIGVASMAIYLLHVVVLALAPRALSMLGVASAPAVIAVGTLVGVYGSLAGFWILQRLRLAGLLGLTGGAPFRLKRDTQPALKASR
jgi:fucose 4-O-acetylase-like acetyltransferase